MIKTPSHYKSALAGLIGCTLVSLTLSSCSSVQRTSKNKLAKTRTIATAPLKASYAQAGIACDNPNMAARSQDRNKKNDQARILVVDEAGRQGIVVADIEVDCAAFHAKNGSKIASAPSYTSSVNTQSASHIQYPELSPQFTATSTQVSYGGASANQLIDYPHGGINTEHGSINTGHAPSQTITNVRAIRAQNTPVTKANIGRRSAKDDYERRLAAIDTANNFYRVRRGDTVYSIAKRHCVAQSALTNTNRISVPFTIHPGQDLKIPDGGC